MSSLLNLVLTYVDADVLIAASRFDVQLHDAALKVLDDPKRTFASSNFLRLETLPKPTSAGYVLQMELLQAYFEAVSQWMIVTQDYLRKAEERACRLGLSAVDALHLEAACSMKVDQFITGERPTSPLFRETEISVVSIRSGVGRL